MKRPLDDASPGRCVPDRFFPYPGPHAGRGYDNYSYSLRLLLSRVPFESWGKPSFAYLTRHMDPYQVCPASGLYSPDPTYPNIMSASPQCFESWFNQGRCLGPGFLLNSGQNCNKLQQKKQQFFWSNPKLLFGPPRTFKLWRSLQPSFLSPFWPSWKWLMRILRF